MNRQRVAEDAVRRFLADDTAAQASAHGAALFAIGDIAFAMACNSHGYAAMGRSCSIEYLAPGFVGDAVTATAVERSVAGRGAIYDVAVTRDRDGQLLAEMRAHSRQVATPPAQGR